MSAALSRLRILLGDPLFQRSNAGLIPTPRARDLASPIAAALQQIEQAMITRPVFQPETAQVTFKIGLQDYPTVVLLPTLMQALERTWPGVSLNVVAFNDRNAAVELLDAGAIDVAIGVPPTNMDVSSVGSY